jgi:hypothetical protein
VQSGVHGLALAVILDALLPEQGERAKADEGVADRGQP